MGVSPDMSASTKVADDARHYVEQLLDEAVEYPVDKDNNSYDMQLPCWYDETLFKRAQKFYNDNIFAMFVGKLVGVISVLAIPSILNVLVHSNGSSTTMSAYRRYMATLLHTQSWYNNELKPGSKSWKSLAAVRKRHIHNSKHAEHAGVGHISQKDMALTQFGFMGFILIKPHMLGVPVSLENFEALVHFWRVIGHMIGIHERYNLATDSWHTTRPRLELMLAQVYRPAMERVPVRFVDMAHALIKGMWCFSPFLTPNAFLYFTKFLCDCDGYVYMGSDLRRLDRASHDADDKIGRMRWYERLLLWFQFSVHTYALNFALVRWYMNSQIRLSLVIIRYFPFLAIFQFGMEKSYVRI